MGKVVQILGRAADLPCDITGQWLVDYDPHALDGRGRIETSPDRSKARVFADLGEFHTLYREAHGLRPDGKPNRPLTAYHLHIEEA